MRVLVFLGVLGAGCVGTPIPPLGPLSDPALQADRVVALSGDGLRAAVVRERPQGLELMQLDVEAAQSQRLVALGDADRKALMESTDRAQLVATVFESGAGGALEALGFSPVERVAGEGVELSIGQLRFDGSAVVLEDGAHSVVIRALRGQRRPDAVEWFASPGRTRVAAELVYLNTPVAARTVWLFATPRLAAEQLSARALELYEQGALREATRLWREALARDPDHGDSHYNLACAEARLGDAREALRRLRSAIRVSPHRYRALAKVDPDLDAIRGRREFQRLVFASR